MFHDFYYVFVHRQHYLLPRFQDTQRPHSVQSKCPLSFRKHSVGYLLLEVNFVPTWCAQIQESCTVGASYICRTSGLKVPHSTLRALRLLQNFWKICGSVVYTSNREWITLLSMTSASLFQTWRWRNVRVQQFLKGLRAFSHNSWLLLRWFWWTVTVKHFAVPGKTVLRSQNVFITRHIILVVSDVQYSHTYRYSKYPNMIIPYRHCTHIKKRYISVIVFSTQMPTLHCPARSPEDYRIQKTHHS